MKDNKPRKKHVKERSFIKEKEYKKDYSGEASPYHDFMSNLQRSKTHEDEYDEFPEANPDVLSEEDSLYYHHPQVDDELLERIEKVLPLLSHRQRQVLQLVGYEGKSLENCGAILKIGRSGVLKLLNRARKIIQDELDKTDTI